MNNPEKSNESANSEEQVERPARRRSRRATRPTMAPDAQQLAQAQAEAPKKQAEAPKKQELDVLAELGVEEPAKKKSEPAEAKASEPKRDLNLDDLVLPERESEGGKKPAAKRAPKKAAPKADAEKPEKADESQEAQEDQEDDSPRLPATALLFQAPQPAPRAKRSKRAPREEAAEQHQEPEQESAPKRPARDDKPEAEEPAEPARQDADGEDGDADRPRRRRRRGGRGRRRGGQGSGQTEAEESGEETPSEKPAQNQRKPKDSGAGDNDTSKDEQQSGEEGSSSRRRRRRTRSDGAQAARDQVTPLKGSTRLEAKRQRRREGRNASRRRTIITEAEFLARRESVERKMYVREGEGRTQIAVLEDDILVEHYVAQKNQVSMVGNVYLGRVQNVLPSMEAAFVDIGRGRNGVLYAGEVNWDAAGLEGSQPRKIEQALKSGDFVLVQVTKDPIGTKGARLTAQVTLAGRFLVLVPNGSMTGISRKLPEAERSRLKKLLKDLVPEEQGVIVRTAAEGVSEEQLKRDIARLSHQWAEIEKKQAKGTSSPVLLKGEPELATRVVRDIFNEDFSELVISGSTAWKTLSEYVNSVAPDLSERLTHWTDNRDVFAAHRIDEQLTKGTDRKVYLPSGGSLVIDRTEAMTVVDVNTGKYTGSGGTLEETVTKNNLEAAEELVRQLRLRDIGGIIVIDFIDMVLESNRELVPHPPPGGRGDLSRARADDPQASGAGPRGGLLHPVRMLQRAWLHRAQRSGCGEEQQRQEGILEEGPGEEIRTRPGRTRERSGTRAAQGDSADDRCRHLLRARGGCQGFGR